jgi:hypothetical protein
MKNFIKTFPTLSAVVFAITMFVVTYAFIGAAISIIGGFEFYQVARFPLVIFIGLVVGLGVAFAAGEEVQTTGERWARESRPNQEVIDSCHWALENNKSFQVVNGQFELINAPQPGMYVPSVADQVDLAIRNARTLHGY